MYYPNWGIPGGYGSVIQLDTATPTGGTDWNDWTIASALLPSGTTMFMWNPPTGRLYLWEDVKFTDNGDFTGTLAYTQYEVSATWNKGAALSTLEAADINGDGVPDLWTVTPAGDAMAYFVHMFKARATIVPATRPQHLL